MKNSINRNNPEKLAINVREYRRGNQNRNNPEKLAT
jgi:hypothetical protein